MAKAKDKKKDSTPHQTAQASEQAAVAAGTESAAAGAGAQAPANDAPGETVPDPEVAETSAVTSEGAVQETASTVVETAVAPVAAPAEFVTLAFPPKGALLPQSLAAVSVVVKARAERGRRRAGFAFSREETVIPYADLSEQQIAALIADPDLIVSLRVPKPD